MTPPADLAGLRALVEAVAKATTPQSLMEQGLTSNAARDIAAVRVALPAALEELKRVEDVLLKDRIKTREINILTKENREQAAHIARLEGALERSDEDAFQRVADAIVDASEGLSSTWPPGMLFKMTKAAFAAALTPQPPRDDAEWQRVHGADAQAERDVAYWRKRAENAEALYQSQWTRAEHAEALCEKQMARVARLEKLLEEAGRFVRGRQDYLYDQITATLEGRDE